MLFAEYFLMLVTPGTKFGINLALSIIFPNCTDYSSLFSMIDTFLSISLGCRGRRYFKVQVLVIGLQSRVDPHWLKNMVLLHKSPCQTEFL